MPSRKSKRRKVEAVSVRAVHGALSGRRRRWAGDCGRGKSGAEMVAVCLAGGGIRQRLALSR